MKINSILFHFILGVIIGFVSKILHQQQPTDISIHDIVKQVRDAKELWLIKNAKSLQKVKKIRILCLLNTGPKTQYRKAVHVHQTWGRHCDKLLFASTLTDVRLNVIGFNLPDVHGYVWGKEKLMLQYVYKNFGHLYDWFYKGDDDTFAIMENLRLLLSSYSKNDPIYLGYKFNTTQHRWGYISGGAGYALSKTALRTFVEKLLTNKTLCPRIVYDKMSEDCSLPICLAKLNIFAGDSRDWFKRERFFVNQPEKHLFQREKNYSTNWYWKRKYYWSEDGLNCCSNYTVSFHYIQPPYMYRLYYLTYHLKPYGINFRYPPLLNKFDFRKVIRALEMERMNISYRGY